MHACRIEALRTFSAWHFSTLTKGRTIHKFSCISYGLSVCLFRMQFALDYQKIHWKVYTQVSSFGCQHKEEEAIVFVCSWVLFSIQINHKFKYYIHFCTFFVVVINQTLLSLLTIIFWVSESLCAHQWLQATKTWPFAKKNILQIFFYIQHSPTLFFIFKIKFIQIYSQQKEN